MWLGSFDGYSPNFNQAFYKMHRHRDKGKIILKGFLEKLGAKV
jgi:hypothetical protein